MRASLLLPFRLYAGASLVAAAATSSFVKSSFVPPAAPTVASGPYRYPAAAAAAAARVRPASGGSAVVGDFTAATTTSTMLFGKKKKAPPKGKGGKIQVKLLKYVDGTGKVGDVIMVAPAFFENSLKKTGSAVRVTDEEVVTETAEKQKKDREALKGALDLQEKVADVRLVFPMKAGPEGHLFGGIKFKAILSELGKQFPKGALSKTVKIESVKKSGEGGDVVISHDIKELGEYTATLSLLKDINAEFAISVTEVGK